MDAPNGPPSTRQKLHIADPLRADISADAVRLGVSRHERDYDSATLQAALLSDALAAISPVSFWVPEYVCSSAWIEHAPFAFWICDALRPRRFVELGAHYGYSYFAFCQAIDRLGLGTVAYAVDTWQGDEHAGLYDESVFQSVAARNSEKYRAFSTLIRSTFEDALRYFEDESVDLLHIDGRHFYEDVTDDFTLWRRKLSQDAVVLLHDTNVRERRFGVWKFFTEMVKRHPSFQFYHGHGLGIFAPGERIPEALTPLFQASPTATDQIRFLYSALGGAVTRYACTGQLSAQIQHHVAAEAGLRAEIDQHVTTQARLRAEIDQHVTTQAGLRAEIDQHVATQAGLRAEIDQHAATEAAIEEKLVEQQKAAEELRARGETMSAGITDLRAELRRVERESKERTVAADGLRAALAEAERRLNDSEAERTTLQEQVASSESQLSAAREVGRRVLAAWKHDLAAAPMPPPKSRILRLR